MRVRVQQEQKFLVTTERALCRYDNAFIFTNQSEVDFGIILVLMYDWSVSRGMFKLFYKMLIIVFVIALFWKYIARVDDRVC